MDINELILLLTYISIGLTVVAVIITIIINIIAKRKRVYLNKLYKIIDKKK